MAHVCTTGASAVTHKFLELECQERLTIIEGTNITQLSEGIPVALSKSILQFSLKSFSATKLACCKRRFENISRHRIHSSGARQQHDKQFQPNPCNQQWELGILMAHQVLLVSHNNRNQLRGAKFYMIRNKIKQEKVEVTLTSWLLS